MLFIKIISKSRPFSHSLTDIFLEVIAVTNSGDKEEDTDYILALLIPLTHSLRRETRDCGILCTDMRACVTWSCCFSSWRFCGLICNGNNISILIMVCSVCVSVDKDEI